MAHFGQLRAKKHIGFSNAESLLASITARAGYLSNVDREKATKHALAVRSANRSKYGKPGFTGVKKALKQSQNLGFNVWAFIRLAGWPCLYCCHENYLKSLAKDVPAEIWDASC